MSQRDTPPPDTAFERGDDASQPSRWDVLPACRSHCLTYRVGVTRSRIGYVNAVVEGYDWIGRVRTADVAKGILEITVPEDWDELFHKVMADLARDIEVRFIDPEEADNDVPRSP